MLILDMYATTFPVILSGIFNMIFTKTRFYKKHKTPIDHDKRLSDGKRILGDNKTWIGFFSMIVFCIVTQLIWGFILKALELETHSDLYHMHANQYEYNLLIGFLFGLTYMLFELPNSFVKRRLDIEPGKTQNSAIGHIFFVIDQIDSLVGVMAVIFLFSDISFFKYLGYIALGGITHVGINFILLKIRIRRNL